MEPDASSRSTQGHRGSGLSTKPTSANGTWAIWVISSLSVCASEMRSAALRGGRVPTWPLCFALPHRATFCARSLFGPKVDHGTGIDASVGPEHLHMLTLFRRDLGHALHERQRRCTR